MIGRIRFQPGLGQWIRGSRVNANLIAGRFIHEVAGRDLNSALGQSEIQGASTSTSPSTSSATSSTSSTSAPSSNASSSSKAALSGIFDAVLQHHSVEQINSDRDHSSSTSSNVSIDLPFATKSVLKLLVESGRYLVPESSSSSGSSSATLFEEKTPEKMFDPIVSTSLSPRDFIIQRVSNLLSSQPIDKLLETSQFDTVDEVLTHWTLIDPDFHSLPQQPRLAPLGAVAGLSLLLKSRCLDYLRHQAWRIQFFAHKGHKKQRTNIGFHHDNHEVVTNRMDRVMRWESQYVAQFFELYKITGIQELAKHIINTSPDVVYACDSPQSKSSHHHFRIMSAVYELKADIKALKKETISVPINAEDKQAAVAENLSQEKVQDTVQDESPETVQETQDMDQSTVQESINDTPKAQL